ncbi:hypothetical protein V5E97_02555 [Singulisphaera sp. Ch08]|uniref:DUF4198 domain-containing protein n=1 Tax=Singulisphaera sp. Ch08 TaxID=3120278 RepID=A0AAU7CIT5_9BACT
MKRIVFLMALISIARPASAHFVFLLPGPAPGEVRVVFNDQLQVDERIPSERLASTRLTIVSPQGGQSTLDWRKEEHHLSAILPEPRPALVGGVTHYGYARSRHTGNKPVLVKYYPKAVLGQVAEVTSLRLGDVARYEIVPVAAEGPLQLRVLRGSQPTAGVSFSVLTEQESPAQRGKTDKDGWISASFAKPGRYGVWVKVIEPTPGEWEGKPYDEVHHFATLVFDVPESQP